LEFVLHGRVEQHAAACYEPCIPALCRGSVGGDSVYVPTPDNTMTPLLLRPIYPMRHLNQPTSSAGGHPVLLCPAPGAVALGRASRLLHRGRRRGRQRPPDRGLHPGQLRARAAVRGWVCGSAGGQPPQRARVQGMAGGASRIEACPSPCQRHSPCSSPRRAVWLSTSSDLYQDAMRDLSDLGGWEVVARGMWAQSKGRASPLWI
jgi:hypothetical protein